MRYLFAIVLPPLGVALCHRWGHFAINLMVWLLAIPLLLFMGFGVVLWLVCVAHALAVCRISSVDKRLNRLVQAIASRPGETPGPQRS